MTVLLQFLSNHMPLIYAFGPDFRFEDGRLTKGGKRVRIARKAAEALQVLLENPNKTVVEKEFEEKLWPPNEMKDPVEVDNNLKSLISKLRKALDDSKSSPLYIETQREWRDGETVREHGYRFIAEVTILPHDATPAATPKSTEAVTNLPHEQARSDHAAPVAPMAQRYYGDGQYVLKKRTPRFLQDAAAYFEKAIVLDPSFARAHCALAGCYAVIASQSWMSPKEACARAKSAAINAMSLDPKLAEPHAALGFVSVFERDWAKAEQEFQEALRLDATCVTAHHWYSFYLAARKRLGDAIHQMEIARDIEPLSPMIKTNVGTMLYWAGEYDRAIEQYDHVIRLDPDFWYAYWMRGMAYDEKRQYQKAADDQLLALEHCPDQSALLKASLARSLALARDHKGARHKLKEAKETAGHSAMPHYHFAVAHASLGERDAAFRSLLESRSAHEMWICFVHVDPKIESLRNDPHYSELLRSLSL